MRILIVEDEDVSLMTMVHILTCFGDCDTVKNGSNAIEMFQKAYRESEYYNLITMDINLPDMKGFDVVEKIRSFEIENQIGKNHKAKILMVTASLDSFSINESFSKGCEGYIQKPLNKDKISVALRKLNISPIITK